MKISKNVVAGIVYEARTQDGVLFDESTKSKPLEYLHGHHNLVEGLEKALEGKAVGDTFEVRVSAAEGYGEYDDNLVQRVPKNLFQTEQELSVGMTFIADTDVGPMPVMITAVEGDEVVVDANHMLAGQEMLFSGEVVSVREATEQELTHGHVHSHDHGGCGCGGHDHDHDDHHHHHHDHGGCGCGGHH